MPVSLPCSLTKTADGRDLYVSDNQGYPNGTIAYFNVVSAPSGGAPGGVVPFDAIYPPFTAPPPFPVGIGQGIPIPPGVYLCRLSVPAVGEAPSGLTKACFVITWDGTQLTAGGAASPDNFNAASCYIGTLTNGTTGVANILVWGYTGLIGANASAEIEITLLQQLPVITPLY
jgi:hypothetical protein